MKINTLIVAFALIPVLFSCSPALAPQGDTRNITLQEVDPNNWRFVATTAIPSRGSARMLDGNNDLMLRNDTLSAQLPYFGVSHTSPIPGTDESGIRFTTTRFKATSQTVSERLDINIEVNDQRFIRSIQLSIQPDGRGTLQVLSNFREPITFNGHMTSLPQQY